MSDKWNISSKNLVLPIIFLAIFGGIGIWGWIANRHVFYLFNFGYIGTSVAIGIFLGGALPKRHKPWGRRITQLLVGCYMLILLGLIGKEDMQIEGFFAYLLLGVFQAAVMHYFIAKIFGPSVFGRAWCGYACWTAMILDFLPWKRPKDGRLRYFGAIRYIHFFLSLGLVLIVR